MPLLQTLFSLDTGILFITITVIVHQVTKPCGNRVKLMRDNSAHSAHIDVPVRWFISTSPKINLLLKLRYCKE